MKHLVIAAVLSGALLTVNGPIASAKSACVPLDGTNIVHTRTHNPGVGMKVQTTESYSYRDGQVVYQFDSTGGVKPANSRLPGGDYIAPYSAAGAQAADPGQTITIFTPGYISTITVCKK